jgi:DNA-directed RNA polymerase subunit omega
MTMMEPKIDDLLDKVDSKYTLVIMSAKRARQINAYYSQLGEGIGEFVPPLVPHAPDDKALSTALKEISANKVAYEKTHEGVK